MFDDIVSGIRYIITNFVLKEKKGPARIGEVRHWKGGYYKKHDEHDWRPVPGPKGQSAHGDKDYPSGHTPDAHDVMRAGGERDKINADQVKHGQGEAKRRHDARMHRMMEAIQDPHKAARRGAAFHAYGHPETAKKFLARAIELGGEEASAAPSKPTTPGVPSTGNKPAAAHAAWSKLVKPAAPSAKPAADPKHLGSADARRVFGAPGGKPEAKPAAGEHRGVTQLSQAERQIIAHAKAVGNLSLLAAERKKRRDRKVKGYGAKHRAKAEGAAVADEAAARAASAEQKKQQLSMAERQAIAEARAKGDPARAAALQAERRKRKVKAYQDKFHGKGKAAKVAVQAAVAAGAAVPVQVPAAVGGAKPGRKPEPSKPTSKDTPALVGTHLNAAAWVANSGKLEKQMGDQIAAWKRRENDGNVNATFFNKLQNGVEVVFKPEGLGYGIKRLRGARFYNTKVQEVEREKCAYELDRVLGIGLVPPVVVREDVIPEKYMQELKDFKEGGDSNMQLGKWPGHGDWKAKGSAMYKVPNSENWAGSEMRRRAVTNGVSSLPKHTQFDLMKMACFDYITGTTDRHYRNLMVDPQGRLAAIDHGLCFPWNADPDSSNPMTGGTGFRSEPFQFLVDDRALRGKLDSDIIKHLKTIKKPDLMAAMKPYKLEQEGEHCWMRLQALVKAGRLGRDLLKSDAWYKTGGVA